MATQRKNQKNLYGALERALKESTAPVTCATLLRIDYVYEAARKGFGSDISDITRRLSDTLGYMWRRGLLSRYRNTDISSQSQYSYSWFEQDVEPVPSPARNSSKPTFDVVELKDGIKIEFEHFVVTIRRR